MARLGRAKSQRADRSARERACWAPRIGLPANRGTVDGVNLDEVRRRTEMRSGNVVVDHLDTFGRAAYHYGPPMRRTA